MPGLLSPLTFAGLTLRNRIVMPPLASGRALPDGRVTDRNVAYYREPAAAGCGMVVVEHAFADPRGRHGPGQLGSHEDAMVEGLARLAEAIREGGAVSCLQVAHSGSLATADVPGCRPVGPSAVPHPRGNGEVPEALDGAGIAAVIEAFAAAAARTKRAGFDAVEVHAAHGFLLSQFLSPLTNRRTDGYGGDLSGRSRLHREVVARVRAEVGPGYPVFVRLGASDDLPGGTTLDEGCRVAAALVEAGADLIDASGGLQGARPATAVGQGYFAHYSEALKRTVPVPVLATGGVTEPAFADQLVREGRADLIGIGRAMLADPRWAARALRELSDR